ncbi:hypothetical protein SFC65_24280 [Priestia filamentosa]|uniref:hypothetical protein n=1 Tax=Priestia filamentosa TaxID=1402861 RepID=UPI003981BFB1
MRRFVSLVSLLCVVVALYGCKSKDDSMPTLSKINEVSISKSKDLDELNEDFFFSSDAKKITANFQEIMKHTTSTNQEVNTRKVNYDILVKYNDDKTHGLHLALGDEGEGSLLTFIGNNNKVYKVSPDDTKRIREIITLGV